MGGGGTGNSLTRMGGGGTGNSLTGGGGGCWEFIDEDGGGLGIH